ncbi:MAG: hypothetical protein ACP5KZ_02950 [bacterium]
MKRVLFFLFLTSFLLARKVVVVSIPGISLEDIIQAGKDNIHFIMENGAIGLVNCRLNKNFPSESAYLSMGSARRLATKEAARLCFSSNESFLQEQANKLFLRNWGFPPPSNSLFHIGLPQIANSNFSLKGKVKYSLLGDLLLEKGIKLILLGNADTLTEPHREASCVLMSSRGIIKRGKIDWQLLRRDAKFPGGLRTDFPALKKELLRYLPFDNSFIFLETGDSLRIDLQYPFISPSMRTYFISRILQDIDDLIAYILHFLKNNDILVLISPYPGRFSLSQGYTLSPIVIFGKEWRGLLTSSTTKTLGVVSLYDFAPTILSFFGRVEKLYLGRKMFPKPAEHQIEMLQEIRQNCMRSWTIHRIISANIIGLTVGFFLLAFILPLGYRGFRYLALFPFILPLASLVLSPFPLTGTQLAIFLPLLVLIIFTLSLLDPKKSPLYLALVLSFLISIDAMLGGKLMAASGMGHSVEEGARYYGIGNEFAGLLVGCSLLLNYYYPSFWGTWMAWAAICLLLGAPWWGANWGGFLTAIITFIYLLFSRIKNRKGVLIYVIVFFSILFVFPIIIDTLTKSTHIGLAFRGLLLGRIGDLAEIAQRKVLTNIKLLRLSDWTVPLVVQTLFLLIYWTFNYFIPKENSSLWLRAVFLSLSIAFAFNDSGVIAGVFLLIPPTSLILVEEIPIEKIKEWIFAFGENKASTS